MARRDHACPERAGREHQEDEQHHQQHGHAAEELEERRWSAPAPICCSRCAANENAIPMTMANTAATAAIRRVLRMPRRTAAPHRRVAEDVPAGRVEHPGRLDPLALTRGAASVKISPASPAAITRIADDRGDAGSPAGPRTGRRRTARWCSSQDRHPLLDRAGDEAQRHRDEEVEAPRRRAGSAMHGVAVVVASCRVGGRTARRRRSRRPPTCSWSSAMKTLISGGTDMRNACGRTTSETVCPNPRPMLRAASAWPIGTPLIPERMASAMNGEV